MLLKFFGVFFLLNLSWKPSYSSALAPNHPVLSGMRCGIVTWQRHAVTLSSVAAGFAGSPDDWLWQSRCVCACVYLCPVTTNMSCIHHKLRSEPNLLLEVLSGHLRSQEDPDKYPCPWNVSSLPLPPLLHPPSMFFTQAHVCLVITT